MIHETKFNQLMESYNHTAGVTQWATGDLVHLSLLIDAELQQRAQETNCETAEDYSDVLENEYDENDEDSR